MKNSLTSDSDMFAAGVPVYLKDNTFWSSEQGMGILDSFLLTIKTNSRINQVFILSWDAQTRKRIEKYPFEIVQVAPPSSWGGSYSFSQSRLLAEAFSRHSQLKMDKLAIIDHRNIDFNSKTLDRMLTAFEQHQQSGVISVVPCSDHPSQLRSYGTFLGCCIFRIQKQAPPVENGSRMGVCSHQIIRPKKNGWGELSVSVCSSNSRVSVSINCRKAPVKEVIAHVLPFTEEAPLYNHFFSIVTDLSGNKALVEEDCRQFSGFVFTLIADDISGHYDSVEFFTPENGDWDIGAEKNAAVDKKTHIPLQGRQQFTPVYSYDGAFYASCADVLREGKYLKPAPIKLERSSIVSDLIDYYKYDSMLKLEQN